MNDLTTAEFFLGLWATIATILAVYYHHQIKMHIRAGSVLTKMLKMVAMGAVKPQRKSDGSVTLENDDVRMRIMEVLEDE